VRILLSLMCLLTACGTRKPAPSCVEVADHVLSLFGGVGDREAVATRDIFAARCEMDRWSADARSCVVSTKSLTDPKNCKQKLTPGQSEQLEADLAAEADREAAKVIPGSCTRYEQVLAKLMACESFPKTERDALAQKFAAFKASWEQVEDKRTLGEVCAPALAAVKMAASECPDAANW
jgi:hypothetical protein